MVWYKGDMFTKHPSFIPDGLFNCSLLVLFESCSKSVNLLMRLSFHNFFFISRDQEVRMKRRMRGYSEQRN